VKEYGEQYQATEEAEKAWTEANAASTKTQCPAATHRDAVDSSWWTIECIAGTATAASRSARVTVKRHRSGTVSRRLDRMIVV
jgi:hypothetical protein